MIKIQDYDKEKQKINFVTDMSVGMANAIRRSVLEIPVMAVDEVDISKNDSALFDEILAHRIGLVPIKTEKVTLKEQKFKLKKVGPCTVTSKDISPSVGTDMELPIVFLGEGQEVELVANAKLGKGTEHIKYSPGLLYYRDNLPEDVLDLVSVENGKVVVNEEELKVKGIGEDKINELKKIKEINELLFSIESWGQIGVKDIFTNAIDVLNKNLTELNKSVK